MTILSHFKINTLIPVVLCVQLLLTACIMYEIQARYHMRGPATLRKNVTPERFRHLNLQKDRFDSLLISWRIEAEEGEISFRRVRGQDNMLCGTLSQTTGIGFSTFMQSLCVPTGVGRELSNNARKVNFTCSTAPLGFIPALRCGKPLKMSMVVLPYETFTRTIWLLIFKLYQIPLSYHH